MSKHLMFLYRTLSKLQLGYMNMVRVVKTFSPENKDFWMKIKIKNEKGKYE